MSHTSGPHHSSSPSTYEPPTYEPAKQPVPKSPQIYTSSVKCIGPVDFPEWKGEKHYMVPFKKSYGLPRSLSRFDTTVAMMLSNIDVGDVTMYLMIDEGAIAAGTFHRRPGLHIDGYWNDSPCSNSKWNPSSSFDSPEALLIASSHQGSVAFRGSFKGPIGHGGDCSSIDPAGMQLVELLPNKCWKGNVTMLHESTPALVDMKRTLVRINIPGVE